MDVIATLGKLHTNTNILLEELRNLGVFKARINIKKDACINNTEEMYSMICQIIEQNEDMDFIIDINYPKDTVRAAIREQLDSLFVNQDDEILIGFCDENSTSDLIFICPFIDLAKGNEIIYGDGYNVLTIIEKMNSNTYVAKVRNNGEIYTNRSFHFSPEIVCTSKYASQNINLIKHIAKNHKISCALSFVEDKKEVIVFRNAIENACPIIAKIETHKGLGGLDDILTVTNKVMLGRGDLFYHIPIATFLDCQRDFAHHCSQKDAYSTVATGILNSMIERPVPERSDLIDVLILKELGINAVVLSNKLVASKNLRDALLLLSTIVDK